MRAPDLDRAAVERLARERRDPDVLLERRLAALARLGRAAWPTGQEEEWRRFSLDEAPLGTALPAPASVERTALPATLAERGVVFADLGDAARERPDQVARLLRSDGAGLASHDALRALAGAAHGDGSTLLHVPADVAVEVPLRSRARWAAGGGAIVTRTVVHAERGASVTFVEDVASDPGLGARLAVPLTEIHVGEGARVRYVRIQRFGEDVWDLGVQDYASDRDSSLDSFNVLVGSGRSKVGVGSTMLSDGARVRLHGLIAAAGTQRIDVNSFQQVAGRGSESDLLYLSALYDAAKAVYYGVIRVEPTSRGTGSYQECRNILLSDRAGADPIPVLEILTNDVARCGHGATAGAIDLTELFYVMSRGFDRTGAERLLVRGFFQRVVDRIDEPTVRAAVLEALAPRIGRIAELDEVAA